MKTLNAFVVFLVLLSGLQTFAAIACRPGMNNCPGSPKLHEHRINK